MGNDSAVWEGCKKYEEKVKEVTQTINVKSYTEVTKSDMAYVNEKLGSKSSYIKDKVLKINSFIFILTNVLEIDRIALYKEPSCLKDKVSTLNFK